MSRFAIAGSALALAAMLALQGCGSGKGGSGTTVTTTATPAATTTAKITTTEKKTTTSTTTLHIYPGGLPECEEIDTFYHTSYDTGKKEAAGACRPSVSPGAYYTKTGQKQPDSKNDKEWECFSAKFDQKLWTNEAARKKGFEGACLFGDYNSTTTPDQIEDCSKHLPHHPKKCSPGPFANWGACWSKSSENWKCVPNDDPTIAGLAKGDCKAQVLLDASGQPTTRFYDGVCRFKKEKTHVYKCDTVPMTSSCAKTADGACFTLQKGVAWQCFSKAQSLPPSCDWVTLPNEDTKFYTGGCVFKGSDEYPDAEDFPHLDNNFDSSIAV